MINVHIVPRARRDKRPYHHGDLRHALIDAALDAIAEVGPESFTLRDVARRAGVSPAAPYRHFADKDALLVAVAAECAQRLGAAMQAAVDAAPDDPLERFRATGIAYVRFAVEHPAHFRAMHLPGIAAKVPAPMRADADAWKARERERLVAAQQGGQMSDVALEAILLAANSLVHGLARLIVDGEDGFAGTTPDQAEALAVVVTDVLGLGLLPRPSGSRRMPRRGARARRGWSPRPRSGKLAPRGGDSSGRPGAGERRAWRHAPG